MVNLRRHNIDKGKEAVRKEIGEYEALVQRHTSAKLARERSYANMEARERDLEREIERLRGELENIRLQRELLQMD